tara:strand:+ start:156 stop:632 length:477 start_codon:yes stop_codon:yes gene_type:complete
MATINATINISSSDISSNSLGLSRTMTMTKHTASTSVGDGLEFTSGLVRRKLNATTLIDLVTVGAQMYGTPTASVANKLYIKNTGSSSTDYIDVAIGDSETDSGEELLATGGNSKITLGRLYGGDWMLIPFEGTSNNDIMVAPSTAETTTVEWMLFFE